MLKEYSENLIGYSQIGLTEFGLYGQDTKQAFVANLKLQPQDWIYRYKRVFYNRNSKGHRSKEIEDLDKDFILFLGCSNTVGSAVVLEETFPYIVSKELEIDYYNLAVEGAGYDLIAHNVSSWFRNIKLKPKIIVIKWPQIYRTFRSYNQNIIPIGPWSCKSDIDEKISRDDWKNFQSVLPTDYFNHYSIILRNTITNLLSYQDIKIIEVEEIENVDYGRDCKHPGSNTHSLFARSILRSLGQ